jgi:acyl-CoA reductase-like NAD-dependent aldehyde dehydrogenase
LIGGEIVPSADGATMSAINPATGRVLCDIPLGSPEDVGRAVSAARASFPLWRDTPAAERAAAVSRLADAVESHGDELALLDTWDNGTPIREMRNDVRFAAAQMRYFAGLALQLRGETIPTPDGSLDFTVHEPFGVVGRIIPFNHPLLFAAARIAAPLVAGNTVVLKPSEQTSLSALRLGALAREILPAGVLNVVTGYGDTVGDALVRHPDVPRIAFTGDVAVGRRIQASAAEAAVKTVTLELGGKNPLIVFPDADIDAAVAGAVRGMNFAWQGQSCGSTSRLFVHRSIFDAFVDALGARMDALRQGDPTDETTEVGAIVSERQHAKVTTYIEMGLDHPGARLVAGGGPPQDDALRDGLFVRPTLFVVEDDDIPLVREEIFGPVLVAMAFDTYEEVIERANSVHFGLTGSVWTADVRTALRAARDLRAGYIWVNTSSMHIPGAPFGGVKSSGVGREEGIEELYSYTQVKNVNIAL